ncbi:polymorphic toxin-type HINT domain-containing protein [Aquimarina sp. RZ0]|uniref:polymorphic toxin-type HINT domain-containing protein n=1 Tax=Aquimarina sp. RZ0 TaxID=2607730 RepID=UPI0011F0F4BB|nr:polymorphic toxin-type HINT domain-containing protein [Aquimarina sp. RZ0]KAA1247219.1 DUF4280 domain-containing protein [Aquimarina sp. RZ0]KAA1247226.1 DUF4280 domain-containing protein [Aquimarina sp. RZ0]
MPNDLEYIVKDALMLCDKGAAPAPFAPTHNTHIKINNCLVTTKADKIPMTNIPTFGACTVKNGNPCTPAPIDWTDTYKVKVKGQETILYKSKLPCGTGGKIEFITSGQIKLPPEEYDKLIEEHGQKEDEGGWGWWDTVELIPVIGSIVGAVREGAKGNWGMMAMNIGFLVLDVAGLISFGATTAASTAAKTGIKAGIKATAKSAAKGVAKLGTKAGAKQLAKGAGKAFAKSAAKAVDNIALKTGKVCVFACFTAGTKIAVQDGHKNIEDIQQGDLVWAYNDETGASDLKPVLTIMQREIDATIELTLGTEIIETTAEHPFYTRSGWKDAADLTKEDEVKTKNGKWQRIEATNFLYSKKKVYNFEVADWHTYFVGAWEWLVHNTKACLKVSAKKIKDGVYDLTLKFKDDWSKTQKKVAKEKAEALTKAPTKVVKSPARKSGTRKTFKKKGGKVKKGQDVDHTVELQLGGVDDVSNMKALDSSVNRSFGRQIQNQIKDLPAGTIIRNVKIQ